MTLLLTQMAIILVITVACGWLALKVGQARVIGEIIGGIIIGTSVFGRFAPHLSATLFPPSSFGPFETLSTVGLVLFLFLIGIELDYDHLVRQRATAIMASGASILLPLAWPHCWLIRCESASRRMASATSPLCSSSGSP